MKTFHTAPSKSENMIEHYDINPDGDVLLTCFQAIEKSSTLTDCNDTTVLLQDENSQDILAEDLVVRQTSSFYDTSIEGYRELEGIDSRQEENLKDVRNSSSSQVDPFCGGANSV